MRLLLILTLAITLSYNQLAIAKSPNGKVSSANNDKKKKSETKTVLKEVSVGVKNKTDNNKKYKQKQSNKNKSNNTDSTKNEGKKVKVKKGTKITKVTINEVVSNKKADSTPLTEKQVLSIWKKRKKDITPLQLKDIVEENSRLKAQNIDISTKQQQIQSLFKKDKLSQINELKKEIDSLAKQNMLNDNELKNLASLNNRLASLQNNKSANVSIDDLNDIRNNLSSIKEKYTSLTPYGLKASGKLSISDYIAFLEKQLVDLKKMFLNTSSKSTKEDIAKIIHLIEKELSMLRDNFPKEYEDLLHKGVAFQVQIGAYKDIDISKLSKDAVYEGELHQDMINGYNQYTLRTFRNYWEADKFKKLMRVMGIKDAWIVALKDGKRVPLKDVLSQVRKQK